MKTIAFINPPLYYDHNQIAHSLDTSLPPLGILYLATYLNKNSKIFFSKIYDLAQNKLPLDQAVSTILKTKPFAICITSMTPQLQATYSLAKEIKKRQPSQIIILGGSHISADPQFIHRNQKLFDYAITGEAEITLNKTLNSLYEGKKIPLIQSGQITKNLDDLPIPDRQLIDRKKYQKNESIVFSRGCPFHCYYCSRPAVSKTIRHRSVKNLIQEINQTKSFNHGFIDFQDDTFTLNKTLVSQFCKHVIKHNMKLNWSCNTRIDMVDNKLLTLMKQSGCRQINFGVESASFRLRKNIIKKGHFTNKNIKAVFTKCHQLKIKVAAYFIIGHPTETIKDIKHTQKMILSYPIDILGLSIPLPFPGSPLYDIAQKRGIISTKIIDDFTKQKLGIGYSGIYPQFHPKNISLDFLYKQLKLINQKFYIKPNIIIPNLINDFLKPKKMLNNLKDFYYLLKYGVSSRKPYIKNK